MSPRPERNRTITNETQRHAAVKTEDLAVTLEQQDMQEVLSLPGGRRWMSRILKMCKYGARPNSPVWEGEDTIDVNRTMVMVGQQMLGRVLMDKMWDLTPELYVQLATEDLELEAEVATRSAAALIKRAAANEEDSDADS